LCTGCIASRWEGGKKLKLKKAPVPALPAFAPVPALPPFLLSQSAGCLSAESAGVQARG
jgi:hypothetical protein